MCIINAETVLITTVINWYSLRGVKCHCTLKFCIRVMYEYYSYVFIYRCLHYDEIYLFITIVALHKEPNAPKWSTSRKIIKLTEEKKHHV